MSNLSPAALAAASAIFAEDSVAVCAAVAAGVADPIGSVMAALDPVASTLAALPGVSAAVFGPLDGGPCVCVNLASDFGIFVIPTATAGAFSLSVTAPCGTALTSVGANSDLLLAGVVDFVTGLASLRSL